MSLFDRLMSSRPARGAPTDTATDDVSPVGDAMAVNTGAQNKQRMLLAGVGGIALIGSCWFIFGDDSKPAGLASGAEKEIKVSTGDLVNRQLSEAEWMARSENRFDSTDNQLRGVQGQSAQLAAMQKEVDALRDQNSSMSSDGQRVLSAYQTENETLKSQLANAQSAPPPPPPSATALYGRGSPPMFQPPSGGDAAPVRVSLPREVKTVSFTSGPGGNAQRPDRGTTVYSDSPDYLPANSFAKARVIVGVDASAGVSSQTDPLPVVLRITGPARSVADNGRVLTTRIQGCLINGAARGDLSSEKVYVKLQRMTCAQPGGRVAVSEVKGFIAFGGKTGVRGRVVSREGSLATQAFLAGLVSSAGSALNGAFAAPVATISTGENGERNRTPSLGNVGLRALGGGAEQTGKTVSEYLIERAEQYQPVIEMPTGVDVEIVFLDGAFVRD